MKFANCCKAKTPYEIIYSGRRTLALEIAKDARIIVRAPFGYSKRRIEQFVSAHENWISVHLERQQRRQKREMQTDADESALRRKAAEILPQRVAYFANLTGLYPTQVKVTGARTRFGSCSAKNSICFSFRLMAYPPEAVDYVVLHELAHIRYKNHGKEFYKLIETYMPDYKGRLALLK